MKLFTIGHSNLTLSDLVRQLSAQGVDILCDVRSYPMSRYSPQFNGENLKLQLPNHGIAYRFLGTNLGGRPANQSCYVDGRVDYERVAVTPEFQNGLNELSSLSREATVAVMCSEKDPINCHRALLVSRALAASGASIAHIQPSRPLESQEDLETRLFAAGHLSPDDLFQSRSQLVSQAYRIQAEKVSFVADGD